MDHHDIEAAKANAQVARRNEMETLVRQTGLLLSEAATLVDAGGPICSRCGERVAREDVAEHVAAHVG